MRALVGAAFAAVLVLPGCKGFQLSFPSGGGGGQSQPDARPPSGGGSSGGGSTSGGSTSQGAKYKRGPRAGTPLHNLAGYAPLIAIAGEKAHAFQSSTAATTIGEYIYVANLDNWLRRHPPGTPMFNATMYHEQVHARRQLRDGVDPWIDRYLNDRAFMWAEEQRGWYEHIVYLRRQNLQIDPGALAGNLAGYRNLRGSMVSRAEAKRWVEDVIAGRWHPPAE